MTIKNSVAVNTYDEVTGPEFYNKAIRIECIVTGKSLTPYQIPKVIVIKCTSEDCEGKCQYQKECTIQMNAVDQDILRTLDRAAVSYQIVLTKADRISAAELDESRAAVASALVRRPAAFPEILATSAQSGAGIAELRAAIIRLLRERG